MKLVVHCKREAYDILIDRSTIWGNPFSHKSGTAAKFLVGSREESIAAFERYLLGNPALMTLVKTFLRGKVLGCWCDPQPCHGHVLARVANE